MSNVEVIKHTTENFRIKDFNFLIESDGKYNVTVSYKRFVVSYQPLFSVGVDDLPRLIEMLTKMQTALSESKGGQS